METKPEETGSWLQELSILVRHIQEETAKAQLAHCQSAINYWREKCYNDTMSAKKSGYDDAIKMNEAIVKAEREKTLREIGEWYDNASSYQIVHGLEFMRKGVMPQLKSGIKE